MTEIKFRLVRSLLKPINTSAVILLSTLTLIWGAWVVHPFWEVFNKGSVYESMHDFAPEWTWGIIAIAVGIMMTYGVVKSSYHSLTWGAIAGFMYWFFTGIFMLLGDWRNPTSIIVVFIALYCAFIALNIRVNRKLTHSLHFNNANDNIKP